MFVLASARNINDLDSGVKPQNESKRSAGYGKDAVRRRHAEYRFYFTNIVYVLVADQVPLREPPTKSCDFAGPGSGWHAVPGCRLFQRAECRAQCLPPALLYLFPPFSRGGGKIGANKVADCFTWYKDKEMYIQMCRCYRTLLFRQANSRTSPRQYFYPRWWHHQTAGTDCTFSLCLPINYHYNIPTCMTYNVWTL